MQTDHDEDCPNITEHRDGLSAMIGPAAAYHMRKDHLCTAHARISTIIFRVLCWGILGGACGASAIAYLLWPTP